MFEWGKKLNRFQHVVLLLLLNSTESQQVNLFSILIHHEPTTKVRTHNSIMRTPSPIPDPESSDDDEIMEVPVNNSRNINEANLKKLKVKYRDVFAIYDDQGTATFDEIFRSAFPKLDKLYNNFKEEVATFKENNFTEYLLNSANQIVVFESLLKKCKLVLIAKVCDHTVLPCLTETPNVSQLYFRTTQ